MSFPQTLTFRNSAPKFSEESIEEISVYMRECVCSCKGGSTAAQCSDMHRVIIISINMKIVFLCYCVIFIFIIFIFIFILLLLFIIINVICERIVSRFFESILTQIHRMTQGTRGFQVGFPAVFDAHPGLFLPSQLLLPFNSFTHVE